MSLAARFNHDLCKRLTELVPHAWSTELRINKSNREAVDVGCLPDGRRHKPILIEAELRREDPASNILKIWNRLLDGAYPRGVVLIQGFSKVYYSRKYSNRQLKGKLAKRLGAEIERLTKRSLRYIPVDIPYFPRAGSNEGNGARRKAARWFAGEIAGRLSKL